MKKKISEFNMFLGKLKCKDNASLIESIKQGFSLIYEGVDIIQKGIDIPVSDPRVFTIPTKLAMSMRGFDRLGDDVDMNKQSWKLLKDDIQKNGLKTACRIETDGTDCWLGTGNHRVICFDMLGIDELPVYLVKDMEYECKSPYMKIPIEMIEK